MEQKSDENEVKKPRRNSKKSTRRKPSKSVESPKPPPEAPTPPAEAPRPPPEPVPTPEPAAPASPEPIAELDPAPEPFGLSEKERKKLLKAEAKADRRRQKFEKKREKQERKRAGRGEKDAPATEKLFSEKHPGAHEGVMSFLPRMHTIAFLILLIYAGVMEIAHGNIDFPLDWYNDSYILPAFFDLVTHPNSIELWFNQYGAIFIAITSLVVMGVLTVYLCVWRFFFKDYYLLIVDNWKERHELTAVKDGRLYWHTENAWYKAWDTLYHGQPMKRKKVIYIKQSSWWHPFNIINPASSLIKIELSDEESVESRGIYSVYGHEKPIRTRVSRKTYMTEEKSFTTDRVPLEQAEAAFNVANERLVDETRVLTQGNAALRLEQMRDGGFTLNPKIREMVKNAEPTKKPDA